MGNEPLKPRDTSRADCPRLATKNDIEELAADVRYVWRELATDVDKTAKKLAWFFIGFMMSQFALLLAVVYMLAG